MKHLLWDAQQLVTKKAAQKSSKQNGVRVYAGRNGLIQGPSIVFRINGVSVVQPKLTNTSCTRGLAASPSHTGLAALFVSHVG